MIADGYDPEVDRYRELVQNSKKWLDDYQTKLRTDSWIASLKIKYTNASGYFIEISKSKSTDTPAFFVHKQTLVNAIRYTTTELSNFQNEIWQAHSKMASREYEVFQDVREKILLHDQFVREHHKKIAEIDVCASLATSAQKHDYIKPSVHIWDELKIDKWRHPIIETYSGDFISNNLSLTEKNFCHVITGPNMWWKSTFLRQNAIIYVMSHIGSFVPASYASIPLSDKIFSRIGANDNSFLGQSTFMVEMQEVAHIMNNVTSKSFVIIDEVGRGTSTYDGMSIAWAILKENFDVSKTKMLFSTHYHELTDEIQSLKWVENYSISVWENNWEIVFFHKIIPWAINKSYGIEVAKLSGLNKNIISESKKMLKKLQWLHEWQLSIWFTPQDLCEEIDEKSEIEIAIEKLDLENMTPIEAMLELEKIKKITK